MAGPEPALVTISGASVTYAGGGGGNGYTAVGGARWSRRWRAMEDINSGADQYRHCWRSKHWWQEAAVITPVSTISE